MRGQNNWKWEPLGILKNSTFYTLLLLVWIGKDGLMQSLSPCKIHLFVGKRKEKQIGKKKFLSIRTAQVLPCLHTSDPSTDSDLLTLLVNN